MLLGVPLSSKIRMHLYSSYSEGTSHMRVLWTFQKVRKFFLLMPFLKFLQPEIFNVPRCPISGSMSWTLSLWSHSSGTGSAQRLHCLLGQRKVSFFPEAMYSNSTVQIFTVAGQTEPSEGDNHCFGFDPEKDIDGTWITCSYERSGKSLDSSFGDCGHGILGEHAIFCFHGIDFSNSWASVFVSCKWQKTGTTWL